MKDNFDKLFERDFDISEPSLGHFDLFEKRLASPLKKNRNNWKWISVAASIVILFSVWLGQNQQSEGLELADVSPKMEETQDYFTSLIRVEINKINTQKTPENEKLIDDSFQRLTNLETQYSKLTIELKQSNEDKRVIFAMINNYQQRIEILQNLIEQLDNLEQIKTDNYENYI